MTRNELCKIYDFTQYLPISLLRRHEEDGKELFKISYMCSSLKITLTKNVRGRLMFLDDHMSSSGRNEKHLKVTFAKFAAAAAAEAGRGGVRKDKTETVH